MPGVAPRWRAFRPLAELARFLPNKARRTTFLSTDRYAGSKLLGGNMTVGDIPIAGSDRKTSRTFNLDEFSRTLIAAALMVGDGLILTTLSYVSLSFVAYIQHHETVNIEYFSYVFLTIGTTITMICSFARSGAYDVSDAFNSVGTWRSTVKRLVEVILLLTACLFILKVSDSVSRLWLAT